MTMLTSGYEITELRQENSVTRNQFLIDDRSSEGAILARATTVRVDPSLELLVDLVRWKEVVVTPLDIQVSELRSLEARIERLNAIDKAFGSLASLSSDEMSRFEEAAARRPLFE